MGCDEKLIDILVKNRVISALRSRAYTRSIREKPLDGEREDIVIKLIGRLTCGVSLEFLSFLHLLFSRISQLEGGDPASKEDGSVCESTTDGVMAQPEENDSLSPADESNIFINAADGLPNQHPLQHMDSDDDHEATDADSLDDLPTSIIVTNIHSEVFTNEELKADMENLFRSFSDAITFHWLKSFKRLRVNFDSALAAASARLQLHQYQFSKSVISCYFAQPVTPVSHKNLQPPAPVKQFLISPPSSPPAGWEPREENEPLVNHDLLAALANLTPGESHEVHPSSESQPAIIVHTALMAPAVPEEEPPKMKIIHTKCPERQS